MPRSCNQIKSLFILIIIVIMLFPIHYNTLNRQSKYRVGQFTDLPRSVVLLLVVDKEEANLDSWVYPIPVKD